MFKPRLHILCTKRVTDVPLMVEQRATRIAFRVTKGPIIPRPYPDLLYAEIGVLNINDYSGPFVVFYGGNYWHAWESTPDKIARVEALMRSSKRVICISKFLAGMTRERVGIEHVTHLPGGLWGTSHVGYKVNPQRFAVKKDWGIKDKPRVCMSISLSGEIKYRGVPIFLNAVRKVAKRHGVKFVCAGRVKDNTVLAETWLKKYGLVFKPWIRLGDAYDFTSGLGDLNWPGILSRSDVFVHPSMWDTWGCTIADSMMSALPALVFGTTGCVEVGKNVMLADPTDPGGIAQSFEQLLTDEKLRESMGRAALSESKVKMEKHKGDFAKLLMAVLEGKK